MDAWDLIVHLANFLAPAVGVGVLVASVGALRRSRTGGKAGWSWPVQCAVNGLLGSAALAGGLWLFGRDGKMLSYAALVLAVALAQWWGERPRGQ
ncbi:MAG: hypothetical protein RIQ96_1685 [Pseudomonadota bacterium]|jgi:hypothetical protein